MSGTLKDKITNIIGIIVALGTIITTAIGSVPADATMVCLGWCSSNCYNCLGNR